MPKTNNMIEIPPLIFSTTAAVALGVSNQCIVADINNIIQQVQDSNITDAMFQKVTLTDQDGKPYLAYSLTNKGFSLVAMGCCTAPAVRYKLELLADIEN